MDSLLLALRVLVSLVVVVALVWYLARRLGKRPDERSREAEVRVLDRQSLSRHSGVAVVAAGDRRLLVGFADQNIRLITELAPVPAVPKASAAPAETAAAVPPTAPRPASRPLPASVLTPTAASVPTSVPTVPSPAAGRRPALAPVPAGAGLPADTGLPAGRRPGLLAGSVLSPATWQATVRAMQDRTVRR